MDANPTSSARCPDGFYCGPMRSEERSTIFGSEAESYDRYRPSYPRAVIDLVVEGQPETAVDAGCGTGKAARLVAARGVSVVGVEPDERMAEVARAHGVAVTVSTLEDWEIEPCDVMYSAQAWHWIEPHQGALVAAASVQPGGSWMAFWNYETDDDFAKTRDEVYRRFAPELIGQVASTDDDELRLEIVEAFELTDAFSALEVAEVAWTDQITAADLVQRLASHSAHRLLDPTLSKAIDRALTHELGNDRSVHLSYATRVFSARRR